MTRPAISVLLIIGIVASVYAAASSSNRQPADAATVVAGDADDAAASDELQSSSLDSSASTEDDATDRPGAAKTSVPIRSGLLADDVQPDDEGPVPTGIRIADLGLEADIISVGVDLQNRFDVPAAETVGWYQYSALPDQNGATVLAAHVDYNGKPGAFFNLEDLLPGERLELVMDDGSTRGYEVTGNSIHDKEELPFDEVFRKTGDPVLYLITCGGTFNQAERSYESNIVVTALPV